MRDLWAGLRVFAGMAWRADPRRALAVVCLRTFDAAFAALGGWFAKILTDGVVDGDTTKAYLGAAATSAWIASYCAGNLLGHFLQMTVIERTTMIFERDVLSLTLNLPGIEHHERPDYLDRIDLLRADVPKLVSSAWAVVDLVCLAIRIVLTGLLLGGLHPVLLLLPAFAVPMILISGRVQSRMQKFAEETAEIQRLEQHIFGLATSAAAAKELRVFGLEHEIDERGSALWSELSSRRLRVEIFSNAAGFVGWAVFAAGYLGAIGFVVSRIGRGAFTAGDVALVVAAGLQVQGLVGGAVGMVQQAITLTRSMSRYGWLRDYAAQEIARQVDLVPVPARLTHGIELRNLSFRYPETDTDVLTDVNLFLPAGSTVAIVGENGAGKTTLVKLLCQFYRPSSGTILVDGTDLNRFPHDQWRTRISSAFQDFVRFEFLAREAVGVGDVGCIEDSQVVAAAVQRAEASSIIDELPSGLETQVGRQFEGGLDLSGGQWQKLALSRAMMRQEPLLLVLDEPTSALDASAEDHLFERYAGAARAVAAGTGGITVLVSHRFSTVRMADLIIVVTEGRVGEVGTHEQLAQAGGLYAELYEIQARAYR